MTEKKYICNLCRESAKPDEVDSMMIGFEWSSVETIAHKSCYAVENHICLACLEAMVILAGKVKKGRSK